MGRKQIFELELASAVSTFLLRYHGFRARTGAKPKAKPFLRADINANRPASYQLLLATPQMLSS
jgi:hypothetical protein